MKENKETSLSKSKTFNELSEFWDRNDLSDFSDEIHDVDFDVDINKEVIYFSLDKTLTEKVLSLSKLYKQRPGTLLNKWLEEKIETLI